MASCEPAACPVPVSYSAETRNLAADELERLPAGSVLALWIADYVRLRAQARACQEVTR